MSEELIKRLRYDCELALQLGDEARVVLPATDVRTIADTIEAQAAEIKRLREALSDILTRFEPWSPHDYIADKAARAALGETE